MKGYVDLYLLPLPKKEVPRYQRISTEFGRYMRKYGALTYREFLGDDLSVKGMASFTHKAKARRGEVVIAAVVDFKSRAHRDQVIRKTMSDPQVQKFIEKIMQTPLHNPKRMAYGGFKTFVQA
jgi:uncharacterized protein YbaA (DUF1428 family)